MGKRNLRILNGEWQNSSAPLGVGGASPISKELQTLDILRLLEQLDEMVLEKPKRFMGFVWGLDEDEIKMQIAKIRASLPAEIKQAVAKVRESERIVEGAKEDASQTLESAKRDAERTLLESRKEAEQIVEAARVQQQRMVAESEILKIAKAQADEIRNMADRDAVTMRRNSEKYAFDVLCKLEDVAGKVINAVDRGKQDLEKPLPEHAVVQTRERIKV